MQLLAARHERVDEGVGVVFRILGQAIGDGLGADGLEAARVDFGRDVADVVAAVAALGERDLDAVGLEPAQPYAGAEDVHLAAGVIDVILAVHGIADGLEQVTDRCAIRRVAAMSYV